MSLPPGTKLGPYEILAPLGAGGMGEVYKAKDTRLDRTVAIKVLPSHVASNPELRQRFEREARAVSSLNHPHICTLHDIGSENGIDFMVMEHIEGDTLADRLKKGALPLDQALQRGIEIADALDKAHRQGVVHRDLKPGNIMLAKSGAKLLDFGLAKLSESRRSLGEGGSSLPTKQKSLTQPGAILGTFQYMAPEQLEGLEADARTDIFAFGALLYEMVTGDKAFHGKSQASLIGAILKDDPAPISSSRAAGDLAPPALDRMVRKCLNKDPDDRWQSARDVTTELQWIADGGSEAGLATPAQAGFTMTGRLAVLAAGLLLGAVVASWLWSFITPSPSPLSPRRLSINLPLEAPYHLQGTHALSPDGTKLVYVASVEGRRQLYLRSLGELDARPMPGTLSAYAPFFSPDGEWVAFFDRQDRALKKVSIRGGPPLTLCEAQNGSGGSWGADDTIVFVSSGGSGVLFSLFRVAGTGGTPSLLLSSEDLNYGSPAWPEMLPGNEAVLLSLAPVGRIFTEGRVVILSLETGQLETVMEHGYYARYAPSGHLVFLLGGALMAAPFDLDRLAATGPASPIVENVLTNPVSGDSSFAFSQEGSLAFVSGGATVTENTLLWVDRRGASHLVTEERRAYLAPRLSPDGRRLAVAVYDENTARDIWVLDLARDALTRLTFDKGMSTDPVWTPDGKSVIFSSARSGPPNVFSKPSDGSGQATQLSNNEQMTFACSVSPDGNHVLLRHGVFDIGVLSLDKGHATAILLGTPFRELHPEVSPNGRWLGYTSDESGRREIYVQPFPALGGKWQVSTGGGAEPLWNPNGRELFYRNGDKLMSVPVTTGPEFTPGKPVLLFEDHYEVDPFSNDARNYDVSPDGQHFVMIKAEGYSRGTTEIVVVLNWFEELKRLVPTN